MLPSDDRPFDWGRFLVRFVFGAIFGALVGLYLAANFDSTKGQVILAMSVAAVIVGLLAGFWGDQFWESFRDSSLNPFRWFF